MTEMGDSRPRIAHLVNNVTPTSIPMELAARMDDSRFDVLVICFYRQPPDRQPVMEEIEVVELDGRSRLDVTAYRRLYRVLRERRVDVLHTHSNFVGSVGRIIGRLAAVPVIVNTEHTVHDRGLSLIQNLVNAPTLALADGNVFVGRNVLDSLAAWERAFARRTLSLVIRNGVDCCAIDSRKTDEAEIRRRFVLEESQFVVGNVGRLIPAKNQLQLIQAFAELVEVDHRAKLIIVGGGKLRDRLEREAQRFGLTESVVLTGLVERQTVYDILRVVDLFVMPSLWEGIPVALLEAMALAKPVVASDIPAFREVLAGSRAGVLVPRGGVDALARAMISFWEDRTRAEERGLEARRLVEERFSLVHTVRSYEALYAELMSQRDEKSVMADVR